MIRMGREEEMRAILEDRRILHLLRWDGRGVMLLRSRWVILAWFHGFKGCKEERGSIKFKYSNLLLKS